MSQTTSLTLLERLRSPSDQEAWSRFARLYTPLLYYWCRRAGLQEQDSADLVQDVTLRKINGQSAAQFSNWIAVPSRK